MLRSLLLILALLGAALTQAGYYNVQYSGGHCVYSNGYTVDYYLNQYGNEYGGTYGGYPGMMVSCGGTIRATFTYVADPRTPNDRAPSTVIVDQQCIADRGYSGGTCDNGYGDPLVGNRRGERGQPYSYGFVHHYSLKQNGGTPLDTFYVECSPSATASEDDRGADVRYRATATKIGLVLTGGIGDNDHKRYLIGQAAGAYVDGLPLQVQSDSTHPTWTVSGGEPFAGWEAHAPAATFHPLPSPLAGTIAPGWFFKVQAGQANVAFNGHLYVDPGDSPAAGIDLSLNKDCAVDKPDSASLSAYTPQNAGPLALPALPYNGVGLYDPPNPNAMAFRGVDAGPKYVGDLGIRWEAWVHTPNNHGGGGGWNFVQLVYPNRTRTYHGVLQGFSLNGRGPVLDNTYPYYPDPFDPAPNSPGTVPADGSMDYNGDRPATGLEWPDVTQTTANDSFETWLMYRPPGDDSTFVPIKKLSWNWGGVATANASGVWALSSSDSGWAFGGDYPAHPEWFVRLDNGMQWVPSAP